MYTDTPYNRLKMALNEHPKATYIRVERIDLAAILAPTPPDVLREAAERYREAIRRHDYDNDSCR